MLKLYIANKNYSSWSLRPWILMKELGIAFEERLIPFNLADGAPAFSTFSPSGRVPCLIDGDLTIWDSLAIAEYLAEHYPGVWPADRPARAWARCAAAEMHSGFQNVRNLCAMNCGLRVKLFDWPSELLEEWKRVDALWCEGLRRFGGPFLGGASFSAADAFYAPVAFRAQSYTPALSTDAEAYAERLLALNYMREWYASALAEKWRDAAHEAEVKAVGTCVEDLRTGGG